MAVRFKIEATKLAGCYQVEKRNEESLFDLQASEADRGAE